MNWAAPDGGRNLLTRVKKPRMEGNGKGRAPKKGRTHQTNFLQATRREGT